MEAQHPDDFICNLIDADADKICAAIHRLRSRLKNPPLDAEAYLLSLERQSLPKPAILFGKTDQPICRDNYPIMWDFLRGQWEAGQMKMAA